MSITYEEKWDMEKEANRLMKSIKHEEKTNMTECNAVVMSVLEDILKLMKKVINALPDKGTRDGY